MTMSLLHGLPFLNKSTFYAFNIPLDSKDS